MIIFLFSALVRLLMLALYGIVNENLNHNDTLIMNILHVFHSTSVSWRTISKTWTGIPALLHGVSMSRTYKNSLCLFRITERAFAAYADENENSLDMHREPLEVHGHFVARIGLESNFLAAELTAELGCDT